MNRKVITQNINSKVFGLKFIVENFELVLSSYNLRNPFDHSKELYGKCFLFLVTEGSKASVSKRLRLLDQIEDLSYSRLTEFAEYCSANRGDTGSATFLKLKFGEKGEEMKKFRVSKRRNPYDPTYVSKRDNISFDEAVLKIKKYKQNKATSLDGFIARHGEKEGLAKFKKFQKTSNIFSLENLQRKHGQEEAERRLVLHYQNARENSVWCPEYYINRGIDPAVAEEAVSTFQIENSGVSYLAILKRCNGDKEEADIIYEAINRKKDSKSFEHCLESANGNMILAKKLYKHKCEQCDVVSLKSFLRRGLSYDEAAEKHTEAVEQRMFGGFTASSESLKIFESIYQDLVSVEDLEMYIGAFGNSEYFLNSRNFYSYDFTFIMNNDKRIIEHHGEKFHPNPYRLSEAELNEWSQIYSNRTWQEVYARDCAKKDAAISNGFKFLEIWSSDSIEKNLQLCKDFLINYYKETQ